MPLNKEALGTKTDEFTYEVEAEKIIEYAKATNEDNPAFVDESRDGGIVAPPVFAVVPAWTASGAAMSAVVPPPDFLRLVHGEQDISYFTPVRPGDTLTSVAEIVSIEEKATGETATARITTTNQDGEKTAIQNMTIFIRGGGGGGGARPPKEPEPDRGEPAVTVTQKVDEDQTFRYAKASGDHNPIHQDENVAKAAGLPGIINHGLCTMAFTSKAAIDKLCDGDPSRLRRLKVRFSKPVLPGQEITTKFWKTDESDGITSYAFETFNPDGASVIKDGVVEVASQ